MAKDHKEHKTHYKNIKIKKIEHSQVEISGEIGKEALEEARGAALKSLGESVNLPGFRKGNIPENVLVSKLGEQAIMEEAAEILLGHEYQHIVIDNKIDVIGRPQITLTKLARGNDLGFKLTVPVFPEVKLPDYKKIAKDEVKVKEDVAVTKEDVDKVLLEIQKTYAVQIEGTENALEGTSGTAGDAGKDKANLPVINDAFVKKLGDFKDVADFTEKLKENILKEKESRAHEKKRLKIGEALVQAATKTDLPDVMIESELQKMKGQFEDSLSRMGMTFENYLKQIKKSDEDLKKEWRVDAEKNVTLQILMNKIALEEKIAPDAAEVDKEIAHLLEHYKNANAEQIRAYVETMLTNEQVFRFLETQKDSKEK